MGFNSFRSVETNEVFTSPNLLTAARAIGGVALGVAMVRYNLDPTIVAASAAGLAVTDLEGTLIDSTKRWPRLQKLFRIIPSGIGRIADPVADKIYAMSILVGGMVSGAIPAPHAIGILSAEASTTAATGVATLKGVEIDVTKAGKLGMVARCGTIGFDLVAAATEQSGTLHDTLAMAGHVSAATAVVLGSVSCYQILRQSRAQSEPLPFEEA